MSNANDTHEQDVSERKTEAFPQPRTMPNKWDLSTLDGSAVTRGSLRRPVSRGLEQGASGMVNGQITTRPQPEKSSETFPQPRTFPANWELFD